MPVNTPKFSEAIAPLPVQAGQDIAASQEDHSMPVDTPKSSEIIASPLAQAEPDVGIALEEQSRLVDTQSPEAMAPPLAQAGPVAEEHSPHGSVDCSPASTGPMSVDSISPGQQADPAENMVDCQIQTGVAPASDDEDAVSLGGEPEKIAINTFASEFTQPAACTTN
jgi:hypothetical protein